MAQPIEMSFRAPLARRVRTVVLVVAVALTTTGVAGLRLIERTPSPAEVFRLAQEFVESRHSARFEGTMSATFAEEDDDEEEPAPVETTAGRMSGVFDDRVGSRTLTVADDTVDETIVVGKDNYWRSADTEADLENELFVKETLDDEEAALEEFAGAFDLGLDPSGTGAEGLQEVFDFGVDPELVSHDNGVSVIRVELDSEKLFGLMGKKLEISMTMTLTVKDSGELQRLRTEAKVIGSTMDSTVDFSDWGKPVTIEAPPASKIDPTPEVDEEELQAFTAAPIYVPAALPKGWKLDYSYVMSAEESEDDCEQVELDFNPPGGEDDEDAPFVYVYVLPTSCAGELDKDMQPFRAGPYAGGIETDDDDWSWIELRVDDKTTLQVESDLPVADLVTLLSNLRPLTFPLTFGEFALSAAGDA